MRLYFLQIKNDTMGPVRIAPGTACAINTRWLMHYNTNAGNDVITMLIPGEGIVARNGIYAAMSNLTSITVFYG